jgi:hypothetical protein
VPVVNDNYFHSAPVELIFGEQLNLIPEGSIMSAWQFAVRQPGGLTNSQQQLLDALAAIGVTELVGPLFPYGFGFDTAQRFCQD